MRMWNELLWEMCYWVYVFERTLESGFKEVHGYLLLHAVIESITSLALHCLN